MHDVHESGDERTKGGVCKEGRQLGGGSEGKDRPPRPSVREGRLATAFGLPSSLPSSLPPAFLKKYHMTAPMCCRLLQVNYRPQNRPGKKKKNVSAIYEMCSRDLLSRNRFAKHGGVMGLSFTAHCPLLKNKKKKNRKRYSLFLLMFPSACPPSLPPPLCPAGKYV